MDFVSIDFETANEQRSSACSLGLAYFVNGKLVDAKHWLINPRPSHFNPYNVMVHGITESKVKNSDPFSEIWPEVVPYIENQLVVAHNTAFDISVLSRALEYFEIPFPVFNSLCTYKLSQAAIPNISSYRLDSICQHFNVPLIHHNALSDAIACGEVLNRICEDGDLDNLYNKYSFYCGTPIMYADTCIGHDQCGCGIHSSASPRKKKPLFASSASESSKKFCSDESLLDDDFIGKTFVFTGTLESMPRQKAHEIVIRGGGSVKDSVTKVTDYVVCGMQDYNLNVSGKNTSSKLEKAKQIIAAGGKVKLLNEDDFIRMIDDCLYEACLRGGN